MEAAPHESPKQQAPKLCQDKTNDEGSIGDDVLALDCNFQVVNIKEFYLLLTDLRGEMIWEIEIEGVKRMLLAGSTIRSGLSNNFEVMFADNRRVLVIAVLLGKGKLRERCQAGRYMFAIHLLDR